MHEKIMNIRRGNKQSLTKPTVQDGSCDGGLLRIASVNGPVAYFMDITISLLSGL